MRQTTKCYFETMNNKTKSRTKNTKKKFGIKCNNATRMCRLLLFLFESCNWFCARKCIIVFFFFANAQHEHSTLLWTWPMSLAFNQFRHILTLFHTLFQEIGLFFMSFILIILQWNDWRSQILTCEKIVELRLSSSYFVCCCCCLLSSAKIKSIGLILHDRDMYVVLYCWICAVVQDHKSIWTTAIIIVQIEQTRWANNPLTHE